MLNAGATFTDLGAANHGNCSEVDFQESYSIHVGSTVAMMQVSQVVRSYHASYCASYCTSYCASKYLQQASSFVRKC